MPGYSSHIGQTQPPFASLRCHAEIIAILIHSFGMQPTCSACGNFCNYSAPQAEAQTVNVDIEAVYEGGGRAWVVWGLVNGACWLMRT